MAGGAIDPRTRYWSILRPLSPTFFFTRKSICQYGAIAVPNSLERGQQEENQAVM